MSFDPIVLALDRDTLPVVELDSSIDEDDLMGRGNWELSQADIAKMEAVQHKTFVLKIKFDTGYGISTFATVPLVNISDENDMLYLMTIFLEGAIISFVIEKNSEGWHSFIQGVG